MSAHKRRRIYLMRHGSVTYFDKQGKPYLPEQVPLNEIGCAQATAAGKVFAAENLRSQESAEPRVGLGSAA